LQRNQKMPEAAFFNRHSWHHDEKSAQCRYQEHSGYEQSHDVKNDVTEFHRPNALSTKAMTWPICSLPDGPIDRSITERLSMSVCLMPPNISNPELPK